MFTDDQLFEIDARANSHSDLKVSSSQAKIDENFANYYLKTKAYNKYFIVLKCTCKGLQKSIRQLEWQNQSPRRCDTAKSILSKKCMRLVISRLNLCGSIPIAMGVVNLKFNISKTICRL